MATNNIPVPKADEWDKVPKKRGKLVGMLTDTLARSIFIMADPLTGANKGGLSIVSTKEFGRKMPTRSS